MGSTKIVGEEVIEFPHYKAMATFTMDLTWQNQRKFAKNQKAKTRHKTVNFCADPHKAFADSFISN
jgi:hypothetical protein